MSQEPELQHQTDVKMRRCVENTDERSSCWVSQVTCVILSMWTMIYDRTASLYSEPVMQQLFMHWTSLVDIVVLIWPQEPNVWWGDTPNFTHVRCIMVFHNSSYHLSPCILPHFLPSPGSRPFSPAPLGSGTGQLPVVWSLPSVVGTFIPQRTRRSCSTTRRRWWTATRWSSAWRRPGASCPSLFSPSSTISTGEHGRRAGDTHIYTMTVCLIRCRQ